MTCTITYAAADAAAATWEASGAGLSVILYGWQRGSIALTAVNIAKCVIATARNSNPNGIGVTGPG